LVASFHTAQGEPGAGRHAQSAFLASLCESNPMVAGGVILGAACTFARCPNGRPISSLLKATSSFLLAKQEQTKRQNREPPASPTYAPQSECVLSYSPSFGVGLAPLFEPGWRVLRIAPPLAVANQGRWAPCSLSWLLPLNVLRPAYGGAIPACGHYKPASSSLKARYRSS
jgi:hypothetical protein